MLDDLLEDLGYALEELERATTFLELLRHLLDADAPARLPDDELARFSRVLVSAALLVNETAVDFLQVHPDRLAR